MQKKNRKNRKIDLKNKINGNYMLIRMNFRPLKYTCYLCLYTTSHKGHYIRHINTVKHKLLFDANCDKMKGQHVKSHKCSCGRLYSHASSLSRHKNICDGKTRKNKGFVPNKRTCNTEQEHTLINENKTINAKKKEKKDETIDIKSMFLTMMNENKELQNKLLELAKEPKIINNNNQKTINIIQFLNEDCKDAMNLSDFLKNLVMTFDDLENIEDYGYLGGIKQSLLMSLDQMEKTKRPIHCTDIKRRQFYVKDDNKWEKDLSQNKINDAIGTFNTNQFQILSEWKKENPDWVEDDMKQNKVNKLNKELTSIYSHDGPKLKNKIIMELGAITNII